jgi:hypothetical protein
MSPDPLRESCVRLSAGNEISRPDTWFFPIADATQSAPALIACQQIADGEEKIAAHFAGFPLTIAAATS